MFDITYKGLEKLLYNYKLIKAGIELNKHKLENLELGDGLNGVSFNEVTSKTNKINSIAENEVIRKMELENSLKDKIAADINKVQMIDLLLEGLTEAEKSIVELFYIEDMTWGQVSMKTNYSPSWCQELRCKAINKMLSIGNI